MSKDGPGYAPSEYEMLRIFAGPPESTQHVIARHSYRCPHTIPAPAGPAAAIPVFDGSSASEASDSDSFAQAENEVLLKLKIKTPANDELDVNVRRLVDVI